MVYLVQQYFSESAKKFSEKTAVEIKDESISFADLDKYTNKLARFLKQDGVKKGDRVCFCLFKSIDSIASILAILKADAVYVPLDAKAPVKRLEQTVEDAKPRLIIYSRQTQDKVKDFSSDKVLLLNLDEPSIREKINVLSDKELEYKNIDTDLAYIFYTSGSTGKPKGVMITHRNVINATEWAVGEFKISPEDRVSCHPSLHFDLSTFDLYCAFKSGASLILIPEDISLFPADLMKYIEEKQLTVWDSVPSVMVYMSLAGVVKKDCMPSVKKIFFNGEVFPTRFLIEWMKVFPEKEFVNMYGPTEATVQCTFYPIKEIPKDLTKPVPIGKACGNAEVFSLKDDGTLAKPGEKGELCVRGTGVSPGYWNNSEKTSQCFIQNPFNSDFRDIAYKTGDLVYLCEDGNFEFLGRKDNQIKFMGHRIELEDIEWAFQSLPYVKEAVALFVESGDSELKSLVVLLTLKEDKRTEDIKNEAKNLLPSYMIPHKIEIFESFPRTSTGKIDKIEIIKWMKFKSN